MSGNTIGIELDNPPKPAVITPYLAVRDARAALDWYQATFGARVRGEPVAMEDGTIGHAELDLAGATLMLSEERPRARPCRPRSGRCGAGHRPPRGT